MSYNRLQVMRDNIEAIRLALSLGAKGRGAQTAEEIAVLRKYAGFGGLKCILNDANELADAGASRILNCSPRRLNCVALSTITATMTGSSRTIWTH